MKKRKPKPLTRKQATEASVRAGQLNNIRHNLDALEQLAVAMRRVGLFTSANEVSLATQRIWTNIMALLR